MKRKAIKILAFTVAMLLLFGLFGACKEETKTPQDTGTKETSTPAPQQSDKGGDDSKGAEPGDEDKDPAAVVANLPRNETLYFAGLQWGPINGWNPTSSDMNNALAIAASASGSRLTMFETLYMYNMLDGKMYPLLADGDYKWNADMTEMTIKLKKAAKWSDGTPVTAQDVAYTHEFAVKYSTNHALAFGPYIDAIEAVDDSTVVVKAAKNEEGKAKNPLMVIQFLGQTYILQKDWLQKLEERNNYTEAEIKKDPGEDVVYSGPYGPYYADDQKVVLIRNDNYWGKDSSMWGKLPAPKYLAHQMYADNPAGEVAFKAGEVDICQQFIPNIQDLWLKDGLPISTYINDAPYHLSETMPTAWFNTSSYGLDNPVIRKAIAIAVDYDAIIANAMTGQSPTFAKVPRSIMNPTDAEQAMYDKSKVAHLQWVGNDIEGAKKMLDEAGIVDTDGDGWREYNGKKLSYNACCPNGWTDWMAAIEIVAAAGEKIGIEITTMFPEWSVYQTVVTAANQDQYDIFMMGTDGSSPTQPWARLRQLMSSEFIGVEGNWSGNYGHYSNPRIDELIKLIPTETDPAKLKEYYTEAVEIYLTEVPSFSLMYRPAFFHSVNESVWTNYPELNDGNNVPPTNFINGYGIYGLYQIELVNP